MSEMNRRILLVEDNSDERELIKMAFDDAEVSKDFFVVEDGQDAVDYLFCRNRFAERDVDEVPHLILLDLRLPKLTGFEVLKEIRADGKTKDIPVVIFTSSDLTMDMITAYKLGANSIVSKPVDADRFSECVRLIAAYWLIWNRPPPRK